MVLVTGQLRSATGQPLITPFSITLTDYGVKAGLLYLPAKLTVIPDLGGGFAVDLWSNQESDTPVMYRVDTPQGSSFFISIPSGVLGPLDIGKVIVTKSDLKHDTNILNRLAQLESRPVGGGGNGDGVVQVLTIGDGLTGVSFNGSSPVTVTVDQSIARVNSPTLINPKSNQPSAGDNSDRLATTAWASNAANLTTGTIPSARLPSNLAAVTAQRLATPRSIFGQQFDGTADINPLSLGAGLLAPNSSSINIDFSVLASVGDARFTNSREWVAPTVTLLEAQTGTDTNRKAWTSQRVWQAIAAWWETVQGSLARLVSPAFTGSPSAPSPPASDYSTRLATTEWSGNAANLSQGLIPTGRIPTLNQDTTGTAATATKLGTARSILGYPFDGTADIPLALGNGLAVTSNVLGLDPTDSRLTNAREWTANTVTQADAEAGVNTSRTAFTPQRVRQAVVAWWVGFENTIARLNSPTFTGTPTAPSPSAGDASTKLATTEWASNASNLASGVVNASRVPTLNQNTTGNAGSASRLATPRSISLSGGAVSPAVDFDGTTNISLVVSSLSANSLTGVIEDALLSTGIARIASPAFTGTPTAPTPTAGDSSFRLATTSFSSNASNLISGTIPATRVPILNQSTTGNAATSTKLATARNFSITGGVIAAAVSFDGSANVSLAVTALDATLLTGTLDDARLSANVPKMVNGTLSPNSSASQTATALSRPGALLFRTDLTSQRISSSGIVVNNTGELTYSDGERWRRLDGTDTSLFNYTIVSGALPASIPANTFTNFGTFNAVGTGFLESVYLLSVYFSYTDATNQAVGYWQNSGATIITAIQWKAGGSQIPVTFRMGGHNEADYICSVRFATGNTNRVLQLSFDKALTFTVAANSYYRIVLKRLI